jgi:hypothetical protein
MNIMEKLNIVDEGTIESKRAIAAILEVAQ